MNKANVEDEYAAYHSFIVEVLALVSDKGSEHKFCSETDETLYLQVMKDAGMKNIQSALSATSDVSELSSVLVSFLYNCMLYAC